MERSVLLAFILESIIKHLVPLYSYIILWLPLFSLPSCLTPSHPSLRPTWRNLWSTFSRGALKSSQSSWRKAWTPTSTILTQEVRRFMFFLCVLFLNLSRSLCLSLSPTLSISLWSPCLFSPPSAVIFLQSICHSINHFLSRSITPLIFTNTSYCPLCVSFTF